MGQLKADDGSHTVTKQHIRSFPIRLEGFSHRLHERFDSLEEGLVYPVAVPRKFDRMHCYV
jgi:hypothetical protein